MSKTKIEWTEHTINPFPGCTKISEGCRNCYAERLASGRLRRVRGYSTITTDGRWNGSVVDRSVEAKRQLDRIKGHSMVFVNSMGDLFHEAISDVQRDVVYGWMLQRPDLTFQVLTKRPEQAARYYQSCLDDADEYDGLPCPIVNAANIWLGVTAENQQMADERIPLLLEIPAAVRFVSAEPLLGPIEIRATSDERRVDWVIVGCESGPKRRPCETKWVQDIIEQCPAASVRVFVKQISVNGEIWTHPTAIAAELDRPVEDIRQWPNIVSRQS